MKCFKCISNSHISTSFLFIPNWKDKHVHAHPWFPRKPYPIPHQNEQGVYPFLDQKSLPHREERTYMAYIGEYPPTPTPGTKIERDLTTFLRFSSQLLGGLRANSWLKERSWARKGGGGGVKTASPTSPQIPEIFFSQTDQLLNTEMVLTRLGFTIIKNMWDLELFL